MAMVSTLAFGCLLLLSTSFRGIIAAIPQHWLIGIQTFRVLGGVFIVRYLQGEMPGFFAIPAGVGDGLTGIVNLLVAYWLYSGKSYGRGAAIAGTCSQPRTGVDDSGDRCDYWGTRPHIPLGVNTDLRSATGILLIHSYSIIGLLRKTSQQPQPQKPSITAPTSPRQNRNKHPNECN